MFIVQLEARCAKRSALLLPVMRRLAPGDINRALDKTATDWPLDAGREERDKKGERRATDRPRGPLSRPA